MAHLKKSDFVLVCVIMSILSQGRFW